MDFQKLLMEMSPLKFIKIGGVVVLAVVVLAFSLSLIKTSFHNLTTQVGISPSGMPMFVKGGVATNDVSGYGMMGYGGSSIVAPGMPEMAYRDSSGIYPTPYPQGTTGSDAEKFEVTQYSATIETRDLENTCNAITALKARDYVIFENASEYDRGCNYTFKMKIANVDEVLSALKALDPKELTENTYTIKQQLEDLTDEVDVLQKKRDSIDATLKSALNAYDEITKLATNTQNADALAKIINSKVALISSLTQEKININTQLDQLTKAKAQQLDRLDYTYFGVNIYENKFVDFETIVDSWKAAVQSFVQNLNAVLQNITVNLVLIFFLIIQWALYALIALIVVKYGWKIGKTIWYR